MLNINKVYEIDHTCNHKKIDDINGKFLQSIFYFSQATDVGCLKIKKPRKNIV